MFFTSKLLRRFDTFQWVPAFNRSVQVQCESHPESWYVLWHYCFQGEQQTHSDPHWIETILVLTQHHCQNKKCFKSLFFSGRHTRENSRFQFLYQPSRFLLQNRTIMCQSVWLCRQQSYQPPAETHKKSCFPFWLCWQCTEAAKVFFFSKTATKSCKNFHKRCITLSHRDSQTLSLSLWLCHSDKQEESCSDYMIASFKVYYRF